MGGEAGGVTEVGLGMHFNHSVAGSWALRCQRGSMSQRAVSRRGTAAPAGEGEGAAAASSGTSIGGVALAGLLWSSWGGARTHAREGGLVSF